MVRVGFARELARKTVKELEIIAPPVDVEHIAQAYGVKVEYFEGWPKTLRGRFWRTQFLIGINAADIRTRQRFTIAHELGHFFMRHDSDEFSEYESSLNSPKEELDIEASEFASELLMPLKWVKEDFRKIRNADQMAHRYNVSKSAMWLRLLRLNLI